MLASGLHLSGCTASSALARCKSGLNHKPCHAGALVEARQHACRVCGARRAAAPSHPLLLPLLPSSEQVESLLSVLCEETDIAEVELKMGGFKMRVRRSLKGGAAAAAAAAPAAAPAAAAPAPAPAPVAAPAPAAPAAVSIETGDEDEGLLDVTANKVRFWSWLCRPGAVRVLLCSFVCAAHALP